MKDILHDEDQLELLNDILVCVKGRTVRQIHMRIMNEFPDTNLSFPKLESVYTVGMTAVELLKALYPDSVSEPVVPIETEEITDLSEEEQFLKDFNDHLSGEIIFGNNCQTIIAHLRNGNAQFISQPTWERFADFLQQKFCDEYGQWVFHKQGQQPQIKSSEENDLRRKIADEFQECRKQGIPYNTAKAELSKKYGKSEATIRDIDAANSHKIKADELCDEFNAGKMTGKELAEGLNKIRLVEEIRMKSPLKTVTSKK